MFIGFYVDGFFVCIVGFVLVNRLLNVVFFFGVCEDGFVIFIIFQGFSREEIGCCYISDIVYKVIVLMVVECLCVICQNL